MKFKHCYGYIFVFLVSLFILTGCGPSSTSEVDTTKPVITLNGASLLELTKGRAYTELGATATDDRDGTVVVTITGTVVVNVVGSYTITYKAKDSAGNEATLTRIVKVVLPLDTIAPVITLSGDSRIDVERGSTFTDPGATSVDAIDGNITVTSSGVVETATIGEYVITYTARDNAGNTSTLTRVINVYVPTSKITGYAEDDPMPNAKVKVTDKDNNIIAQATADANGKYSLEGEFEEGKIYTLESKGEIADKNVTLHSIFKFSNDTVINANPITELKYQLVQSGKSIDEAESLIRDYFSVVSGEKLERNRFDVNGALAISMADLAKLYDGVLPIDAIEKIKEDILRNAPLEVKDYSYRTTLQEKIELEVSTASVEVANDVNVTISGLKEINNNYMIKWSGTPSSEENKTSIEFTMENPQDVYVRASVYKIDGNRTKFITFADITINFYKLGTESNVTVENASVDNNFSIGENSITIPAGTVTDGKVIRVRELNTGSDKTVAQFEVDAGGAVDGNITFNYKYDPYLVAEPRNLQISLRSGDDIKVLKVIEIDYAEHIVRFEIPLDASISRGITNNADKIIIEYSKSLPSKDNIRDLLSDYKDNIKEIIEEFKPSSSSSNEPTAQEVYDSLYSTLGKAKLVKVLRQKNKSQEYYFNRLARGINNVIALAKSEKLFQENFSGDKSWDNVTSSFYILEQDECRPYHPETNTRGHGYLGYGFVRYQPTVCKDAEKLLADKIVAVNQMILNWVNWSKLTTEQESFGQYAKEAISNAINISTDGIDDGVEDIKNIGYALKIKTLATIISTTPNIGGLLKLSVTESGKSVYSSYSEFVKKENAIKSTPIFISLKQNDKYKELLEINYEKFEAYAIPKEEFQRKVFPIPSVDTVEKLYDILNDTPTTTEEYLNRLYVRNALKIMTAPNSSVKSDDPSQLGSLDPKGDLDKLFLSSISEKVAEGMTSDFSFYTRIENSDRALAFLLLRYAYGDEKARKIFNSLTKASNILSFEILMEAYNIDDSEVEIIREFVDCHISGCHSYTKTIIKSKYDLRNAFISTLSNVFSRSDSIDKRSLRNINSSNITDNISNLLSFNQLMENMSLKLTNSQLETLNIKKVKMETYGVGLKYSDTNNAWTLDRSVKKHHIYVATENINDKFSYDSELEKNVLSFATLFDGEDFTPFDKKLVGFKVTLVVEINGIEKVVSKDFIFTTLADTEHLVETNFTGATLKSSAKDALTGSPIANAQVTLIPGGLTDFTDADGNYEVSGLAAGNYTIVISKEGYRQVEATLDLVEDETKVFEASLAIDDEHATSLGGADVTLKDAINGNVLTNGYIKVREGQNNKTGEVVYEVTNDGNNSLNIELYPNVYTVEVGANGYSKSFNTVTIIGDTNNTYEFSVTPVLAEDQVRVVLTWGENPNDLDSHLVRLSNDSVDYHVYYGDMRPANADANLDTDDTSSYGPETITISGLSNASTYRYYVHDFSNGGNHNDEVFKASGAKVEVYYGDQSKTFYVPNENGNAWKVFEIVNGEIVPCTTGCMFGVDGDTDSNIGLRKLDRHSLDKRYFRNLPSK